MKGKTHTVWIALFAILTLLILGQGSLASETGESRGKDLTAETLPLVSRAQINLVRRLGVDANEIAVAGVERTEFPDASLGASLPNKAYPLVTTQGYNIRLRIGDVVYRYWATPERVVYVGSFIEEGTVGRNLHRASGNQLILSR